MTADPDLPEAGPPTDAPTGRTFYGNRCHAHARSTGERCGNPALAGAKVCRYHGGAAPQVQAKARLRLLELIEPATAVLATILADPKAKPADRLRAVENIYDRAGIPRRTEVDHSAAQALLVERIQEVLARRIGDDVEIHDPAELPARQDTIPGQLIPTPPERLEA
jgi:hypothetical protein